MYFWGNGFLNFANMCLTYYSFMTKFFDLALVMNLLGSCATKISFLTKLDLISNEPFF